MVLEPQARKFARIPPNLRARPRRAQICAHTLSPPLRAKLRAYTPLAREFARNITVKLKKAIWRDPYSLAYVCPASLLELKSAYFPFWGLNRANLRAYPLHARKFARIPPHARKFARIRPHARKFARIPPLARKFARIPPRARKFARIPPLRANLRAYYPCVRICAHIPLCASLRALSFKLKKATWQDPYSLMYVQGYCWNYYSWLTFHFGASSAQICAHTLSCAQICAHTSLRANLRALSSNWRKMKQLSDENPI